MKRALFALTTLALCGLVAEILLGYALWTQDGGLRSSIGAAVGEVFDAGAEVAAGLKGAPDAPVQKVQTTFSPRSPYGPDELLGYADQPGQYHIALTETATGRRHAFTLTVDDAGHRVTSRDPDAYAGQPEIWLFGDSYAYGWGNSDETTFAWLLQQYLRHTRVVNHADNGYGTIQGHLELGDALRQRRGPPAIVVTVYGDYFNERNAATPSRLRTFSRFGQGAFGAAASRFTHPRGRLVGGSLAVDYVALLATTRGRIRAATSSKPSRMRCTPRSGSRRSRSARCRCWRSSRGPTATRSCGARRASVIASVTSGPGTARRSGTTSDPSTGTRDRGLRRTTPSSSMLAWRRCWRLDAGPPSSTS